MFKRLMPAVMFLAAATPVLAHSGHDTASGFLAGFSHPLTGLDHVLAMVGAGLFAALLGGRALMVVPASFVLMIIAGGAIGMADFDIPAVEVAIAASVIAVGTAVALGWAWPVSVAAILVGFFALFHGYAHGVEIPSGAGALPYSTGFALASASLLSLGIVLSHMATSYRGAVRSLGVTIVLAGFALAIG